MLKKEGTKLHLEGSWLISKSLSSSVIFLSYTNFGTPVILVHAKGGNNIIYYLWNLAYQQIIRTTNVHLKMARALEIRGLKALKTLGLRFLHLSRRCL